MPHISILYLALYSITRIHRLNASPSELPTCWYSC